VSGGAIYILGNANILINGCSFTNNSADYGGGIAATQYESLII